MIRHIVLFSVGIDDEEARRAAVAKIVETLTPVGGIVPGVNSLRVDGDPKLVAAHWDAALVSEHTSWDALAEYQQHPAHLAAVEIVNTVVRDRAVVDYEI
ncbi:Dabb family protein [Microbacterium yannicii]|uniref:Dabb family protein n=1 Tax=Microbacterium yannicii TaxID=671622 RepID=UPI0003056FDD|nr:Dabb family protein [Microbacterium yannicii]